MLSEFNPVIETRSKPDERETMEDREIRREVDQHERGEKGKREEGVHF